MNYRFLSPALGELTEAAEYYDLQVPGPGTDFIDEVDLAIDRILHFPEIWSRIAENYRHCNLRRFPYTIIGTVLNESRDFDRFDLSSKPRTIILAA